MLVFEWNVIRIYCIKSLWHSSYIAFCISGFCPLGVQVWPGF